jgi:hypothetical protein
MYGKYSKLRNPTLSFSKCNKILPYIKTIIVRANYFSQDIYTYSNPPNYVVPHLSSLAHTQYLKQSAQDVEDSFELLNSNYWELTLDNIL